MTIISNILPAIGFCTQRLPTNDGYAWTLTSKLGDYLREAEGRYGQRNLEWTILGIEFCGDIPRVWFPKGEKLISVLLTQHAAVDWREALFQLAHEVIHLLEPSHVTPTTVFEEGLATLFQHEISARDQLGKTAIQASYLPAEAAVQDLLALYPDAVRMIRQGTKRPFVDLTSDEILQACPNAPAALAERLVEKFVR